MVVSRLEMLAELAKEFTGKVFDSSSLNIFESNDFLPTMGAEIEVHWRTLIPEYNMWFSNGGVKSFSEDKKRAFDSLCTDIETQKKPLYEKTQKYDIDKGHDGFYEFAFRPVHWYGTAAVEIQILYDAGLINPSFENPLHVTVAGLNNDVDTGILACVCELLGGTSYERLMKACKSGITRRTWDRKGKSGIVKKGKMLLDDAPKGGIELRTLIAKTPVQVYQTLQNIQLVSWGIVSRKDSVEYAHWQDIKQHVMTNVLRPYGLNRWWTQPQKSSEDWNAFGLLLDNTSLVAEKAYLKEKISQLNQLALQKVSYKK